jgi:hypothetical protein
MRYRLASTLALGALAAILAAPATAQIPVPPLPSLEIHFAANAPPRPRVERRTVRPGSDYTWVAGSWDWQGSQWGWLPGRWVRPEARNVAWVRPVYVRDGGGYRYQPGHWSNQRIVEGSDYREWHEKHHNDRDHDRRWDRERDRDQGRDRDHDHDSH